MSPDVRITPIRQAQHLSCVLPRLPAEDYLESANIVARLNLVNMRHGRSQRVQVYGQALRGLLTLETDVDRQLKYADFIDIYGALGDAGQWQYRELYETEDEAMMRWRERVRNEGPQQDMQQGLQQGMLQGRLAGRQEGQRELLAELLVGRFGALDAVSDARLQDSDEEALRRWTRNLLSAQCLEAPACACQPSVPVAAYPDAEDQVEQAVRRTGFSRSGLVAAARVARMTGAMVVVRGVMAVSVVTV